MSEHGFTPSESETLSEQKRFFLALASAIDHPYKDRKIRKDIIRQIEWNDDSQLLHFELQRKQVKRNRTYFLTVSNLFSPDEPKEFYRFYDKGITPPHVCDERWRWLDDQTVTYDTLTQYLRSARTDAMQATNEAFWEVVDGVELHDPSFREKAKSLAAGAIRSVFGSRFN